MTILIYVYAVIFVLGAVPLILSLIVGSLFDFADGIFDGIDEALEGIGVDLFSDSAMETDSGARSGIGTMAVLAFFAIFGGVGLMAVTTFRAGLAVSFLSASAAGIVAAWAVARLTLMLYKLQKSGTLSDTDFVGVEGVVTISAQAGGVGLGSFNVKNEVVRMPIKIEGEVEVKAGCKVRIVGKEGSTARVVVI